MGRSGGGGRALIPWSVAEAEKGRGYSNTQTLVSESLLGGRGGGGGGALKPLVSEFVLALIILLKQLGQGKEKLQSCFVLSRKFASHYRRSSPYELSPGKMKGGECSGVE